MLTSTDAIEALNTLVAIDNGAMGVSYTPGRSDEPIPFHTWVRFEAANGWMFWVFVDGYGIEDWDYIEWVQKPGTTEKIDLDEDVSDAHRTLFNWSPEDRSTWPGSRGKEV